MGSAIACGAEAVSAAEGIVNILDFDELDGFDFLDEQLSDAVSALDLVVFIRMIEEENFYLAPVL